MHQTVTERGPRALTTGVTVAAEDKDNPGVCSKASEDPSLLLLLGTTCAHTDPKDPAAELT